MIFYKSSQNNQQYALRNSHKMEKTQIVELTTGYE